MPIPQGPRSNVPAVWGPAMRHMMFRRTTWTNPPFQPTVQLMGDNAAVAVVPANVPFSGEDLSRDLIAVAHQGARSFGKAASRLASDIEDAFFEALQGTEDAMQRLLRALEEVAGSFSDTEKLAIVTVPFGPAGFFYEIVAGFTDHVHATIWALQTYLVVAILLAFWFRNREGK